MATLFGDDDGTDNLVSRHSCDATTWQTPPNYVEASRKTLGGIDLDPASCARANEVVGAKRFFGPGSTVENGFTTSWEGRVFLNPPGGRCDANGVSLRRKTGSKGWWYADGRPCDGVSRSAAKAWWAKLIDHWTDGSVASAIFLSFSVELIQTSQAPPRAIYVPADFPLCFPARRISFLDGDGKPVVGNTHSSMVVLLPPPGGAAYRETVERFFDAFRPFGKCVNIPSEVAENR